MLSETRVVTLANQKGGVAKTASTINLATAWHRMGLPVVVIDMDPQGNATSGLGVDAESAPYTVWEVLRPEVDQRVKLIDAMASSAAGPLVVPGHLSMASIEKYGNGPGTELSLWGAIKRLPEPMLVVIDTPPNLGRLTTMALYAAGVRPERDDGIPVGEVLAPVKPGADELQAVQYLMTTLRMLDANELGEHHLLGTVLLTMYDGRNQLSKDTKRELKTAFTEDEYLGEVAHTVRVGEAKAAGLPLLDYRPDATASQDYQDRAQDLATKRGWVA